MSDAKYVIVNGGMFGNETAIIFDKMISHEFFKGRAVSAGFVGFSKTEDGKIEVYTYGGSESLNLESREEDSDLICKALNNSYFDEKLFIPLTIHTLMENCLFCLEGENEKMTNEAED